MDFDKEADFRIDIPYYSKDLNDALSTASKKVENMEDGIHMNMLLL